GQPDRGARLSARSVRHHAVWLALDHALNGHARSGRCQGAALCDDPDRADRHHDESAADPGLWPDPGDGDFGFGMVNGGGQFCRCRADAGLDLCARPAAAAARRRMGLSAPARRGIALHHRPGPAEGRADAAGFLGRSGDGGSGQPRGCGHGRRLWRLDAIVELSANARLCDCQRGFGDGGAK
ncbi:hypothetical protein KXV85_003971, partial [Aspergillus fumigatus]